MATEQRASEILETLLMKMGFNAAVASEWRDEVLVLTVEAEKKSALIGYHGENLSALQEVHRLIVYKTLNEWVNSVIDVGGYREERSKKLMDMARRESDKAKFLRKEVDLPPMTSSDRREVHLALSTIPGVRSESNGEGRDRHIVIIPE